MSNKNHPYHLVEPSPWPILGALSVTSMLAGMAKWFHKFNNDLLLISTITTMFIMYQWWRDVTRESTIQGHHTMKVSSGMKWGMILFITSEVLFFMSFFWSFFHSSLTPTIEIGEQWPPLTIKPFNAMQIPLLNSMILLSSGMTVTWAHHSLMENNFNQMKQGLMMTILLGITFTGFQTYEYLEAPFSFSDSVYGSTFFMATGFHGLHVIIGSLFLLMCLIRHMKNHFSKIHHVGFEAAAWYWHFVDVVWLFLFISIYWWGS
uniref:Cytochrome c oxidase subunit 3 n=1 Tax=Chelonarium sp. BMNH 840450 TaxID=1903803 RepID=A0A343A3I9_9COLE|nr:cytochrome c oxidase subunit 3 [Chelonarium sp. BMNH 840450]